MKNKHQQGGGISPRDILIRINRLWKKIPVKEITWLQAADNYVKIFTTSSVHPYLVKGYLKQMEKRLPGNLFCRVHRSFIVGLDYVRHIGSGIINLGQVDIPFGREYVKKLKQKFISINVLPLSVG